MALGAELLLLLQRAVTVVQHICQFGAEDALIVLLLLLDILEAMLQSFASIIDLLQQAVFALSSDVLVLQEMALLHLLLKVSQILQEFFFVFVFSLFAVRIL